ncbi:MAG: hypothetical protein N4A72_21805 [Bacteroidales bacterium]|jgi:hypothetical protein|nr:hypothetical protein [Bacteroidales bacterium]
MKVLYRVLALMFCFHICVNTDAQNDTTQTDTIFHKEIVSSDWIDHGAVMGISFSKYLYGEVGYYRSYIWEAGGFPVLSSTMSYGAEFSYFDKFVLAPKIQGRVHFLFFNASLSALYYTDLKKDYAFKLRPEIGVGLWNLDINYGYNIGIYNNDFNRYNRHVVSVRYYLNFYRNRLNGYDRDGNIVP